MPDHDRRPAIHATATSALRAVAWLLAVVLMLAIAMAILDARSTPGPSPAAPGPHAGQVVPTIRHLVLIHPVASPTFPESRP